MGKVKKGPHRDEKAVVSTELFNPATPEQLARIRSLVKENKNLLKQYLMPYSVALSILGHWGTLRAFARINFIDESLREATYALATSSASAYVTQGQRMAQTGIEAWEKGAATYFNFLQEIPGNIGYTLARRAFEPDEMAATLDALSNPQSSSVALQNYDRNWGQGLVGYLKAVVQDGLTGKERYVNRYINTITALMAGTAPKFLSAAAVMKYYQYRDAKSIEGDIARTNIYRVGTRLTEQEVIVIDEKGLKAKSFTELNNMLAEVQQAHLQTGAEIDQIFPYLLPSLVRKSFEVGMLYAHKWLTAGFTGLGLLGKNYVTDRMVAAAYNRYFEEPLPKGYDKQLISQEQADKVIQQIQRRNRLLIPSAKRNVHLARYIFPIILLVAVYYLFISGNISVEFALFALTTALTAISGLQNEISSWNAARRLETELAARRTHFINAIPECDENDVVSNCYGLEKTLATHNFAIRARKYKNIDAAIVCLIIKEAFLNNGIDFASDGYVSFSVDADSRIDATIAARINRSIVEKLERINGLAQLRQQLGELNKATKTNDSDYVVSRPLRDAKDQRINQFVLLIPAKYQELVTQEKITEIFDSNEVELEEVESDGANATATKYLRLTVTGCAAGDVGKLNDLISAINTFKRLPAKKDSKVHDVPNLPFTEPATANPLRHRSNQVLPDTKDSKTAASSKGSAAQVASSPVIKWNSAVYDSKAAESDVVPMESRYLPRNKFFTFFKLAEEDFPDATSYKCFKSKAERAKLAAKEGDEGVLFIDEMVRDNHGRFFRAKAKLKALETYGDMRVYAAEEQSSTGEMLYVFKGVAANTH